MDNETRECRVCNKTLPLTTRFWYISKCNLTCGDVVFRAHFICRECKNRKNSERYHKKNGINREIKKRMKKIDEMKSCSSCKRYFPTNDVPKLFYKKADSSDGFDRCCIECKQKRRSKYYERKTIINELPSIKKCTQCDFSCEMINASQHFHINKSRKDGFKAKCKECENDRQRDLRKYEKGKLAHFLTPLEERSSWRRRSHLTPIQLFYEHGGANYWHDFIRILPVSNTNVRNDND